MAFSQPAAKPISEMEPGKSSGNIRTPRALGYFIQRPESHCVHHQRDLHAYNYSDFPLWDILMGTFRNPANWEGEAGFGDGAHVRYGAMFLGRDVNPQLVNGSAVKPVATSTAEAPASV